MDMGVSFFGLLAVAVIATLVIGGIVAVVAMLANPKTRAAGAALMVVGLVVVFGVLLVAGLMVSFRATGVRQMARADLSRMEVARQAEENRRQAMGMEMEEMERRASATGGTESRIPLDPSQQTPAEEPPGTTVENETQTALDSGAETDPAAQPPADEPAEEPSTGDAPAKDASSNGEPPPAAEQRPQWVGKPPQAEGPIYRVAVKTDPRPTSAECEGQLPVVLNKAVSAYAETRLGQSAQVARQVELTPQYIRENIVQQKWPEPVEISLGKWVQLHVLLQFDQGAKKLIQKQCEQVELRLEEDRARTAVFRRLCYGGTGLAAVLLLLSVLFAGLKIDQATGGSCRGRLGVGAGAAAVAVVAAACFAVICVQEPAMVTDILQPTSTQIEPEVYSAAELETNQTAMRIGQTARLRGSPRWVLLIGLPLLIALVVALLFSQRTRPIGLGLLGLVLLGGLVHGLSVVHFPMSTGPVELLVVAAATAYVILLTVLSRKQWAWVLGMIACFVIAAIFTPADPASMLLVVVPLCVLYTVAVFAWKAPRRSTPAKLPPGD